MELIRDYWPYLLLALGVILILAFVLMRPKQRVSLSDSAPIRPHMAAPSAPPEGRGIAGEAAAATSDVTGELLRAPVHRNLADDGADDLLLLKGVGPKLAGRIVNELKDKAGALPAAPGTVGAVVHQAGSASADAVSALQNLGFKPAVAAGAVAHAQAELGEDAGLNDLVRVALKRAAG